MGELGELRSRVDHAVERLTTANDTRRRHSQGLMTLLTDLEAKFEARTEELEHSKNRIAALTRENADLSGLVDQLVHIVDTTVTTSDDDALFRASAMAQELVADWRGARDEDAPGNPPDIAMDEPTVPIEDEIASVDETAVESLLADDDDWPVVDDDAGEAPRDSATEALGALDPALRFEDVTEDELASERLDGDPEALSALLDMPLTPDVDATMARALEDRFETPETESEDIAAILAMAELEARDIDPIELEDAGEVGSIEEMMAADLDIPEIAMEDDEPISRVDADEDTESSIRAMMARLEEAAERAKAHVEETSRTDPVADAEKVPVAAQG